MALKKMQGELNTFTTTAGIFDDLCVRLRKAKEKGQHIPDSFFVRKTPEELDKAWEEARLKEIEKNRLESLEFEQKQKEAKVRDILGRSSIPMVFSNKTIEQLKDLDPKTQKTVDMVKDFIDHYHEQKGTGFIFYGLCGTGKTHLSCALLRELTERYAVLGIYVNLTELINKVKYGFSQKVSQGETLQAFKEAEVLVIDEVGAQIGSPFELAVLEEVLLFRYDAQLTTVLVSNMDVLPSEKTRNGEKCLMDFLHPRVMSRVNESYISRSFTGKSFRKWDPMS